MNWKEVRKNAQSKGLYDPRTEHDACGVGFIVHMKGLRSHRIVPHGIGALCNLEHRGALGAEVNETPLTPRRVLAAIRRAQAASCA